MKSTLVAFRANEARKQKLQALAIGEGLSISGVIHRLIDNVPVQPVVKSSLKFASNEKTVDEVYQSSVNGLGTN